MALSNEVRDLCRDYGGFWKFVETARFDIDFVMQYRDEIEDIIHELKEYNFTKNYLEENYLGKNGEPPRYDIKEIKRKNNVKIPKNATEQELRSYGCDYFIQKHRLDIESYL